MTKNDIVGLLISYIYAFGLLFIAEGMGRLFKWSQNFTRKIIHIGAGMWVWGILVLFDTWFIGIIPFVTFIILNYIFYRYKIFKAMDAIDSSPGTIYFAASIATLFALLWRTDGSPDRVAIAIAAVMALTWGDSMANLIGRRYGTHPYTTFEHQRSWEGSVAMFVTSFTCIVVTMAWLPGSTLSPQGTPLPLDSVVLVSAAGAVIATTAESFSPAGTDNLSVPLLTGLILFILAG